jgi:prolyl oligopeptidase
MSTYTLHGRTIEDPYYWLEEPDSAETRNWVKLQNERTQEFFRAVPERESIRKRLTELWNYQKSSIPVKRGSRYFFTQNDGLQDQSILYTVDRIGDTPRLLLDFNTLSDDGTVAMTAMQPSHDGRLVAYGLAGAGSDWEEWRVLDVATGRPTADHLKWIKFSTVSWTADDKGFFYCRYDEPEKGEMFRSSNYFQKLYHHLVGTPQSEDRLVYFRPDEKEWVYEAQTSDDGVYLIIHVWNATGINNALFYRDLQADGPVVELIPTFVSRYQFIGNDGPVFWLQTDQQAPRGRLLSVDIRRPDGWHEIIPEREHTLVATTLVGEHFIAHYIRDAQSNVEIFDLNGAAVRAVTLPGIGSVTGFEGRRDDAETFFDFTSFTTPTRVYRYDVETSDISIFHQPQLSFDPDAFETRQVFYTSKDGTRVPMFISYKRGLKLDGKNPTELYGYGGFNISLTPLFSISRLAWMEMGGIFAVPNLRGGGEYGEDWHQAGIKSRKQNVFDDFIAAAEWLIRNDYTSTPHLGISGRSNGGLLVGACITQRPELFGAAMAGVGVMDMLRFHKFTIGWSWVSDYGSPEDPGDFETLLAYSPYHNVRQGVHYPPTLITTADHDDRVVPAHSYKFAAALQAAQTGDAPILIRIEVRAGHGLGKPTSKLIDEATDVLSFFKHML